MEIWVTLLTIAGALGGTWLGTWLVGRQAAKDLRANIARELEILGKLRPESDEAKLLDSNIRENIAELTAQDELRRRRTRRNTSNVRLFLTFGLVGVAVGQLGGWRARGFWEPLHSLLEGLFWGLCLVYVVLCIGVLMVAASWTKFGARLGVTWGRIGVMKAQTKFGNLRNSLLNRLLEKLVINADAIVSWHEQHEGKQITPGAAAQLQELLARHQKLKRKAARRFRVFRLGSIDQDEPEEWGDNDELRTESSASQ